MTESKAEYRALPVCGVCGNPAVNFHAGAFGVKHHCANKQCTLNHVLFTTNEWRKLMGHPALTHEQVQNIERGLLSRGMNVNGHEIRAIYDAVLREISND